MGKRRSIRKVYTAHSGPQQSDWEGKNEALIVSHVRYSLSTAHSTLRNIKNNRNDIIQANVPCPVEPCIL